VDVEKTSDAGKRRGGKGKTRQLSSSELRTWRKRKKSSRFDGSHILDGGFVSEENPRIGGEKGDGNRRFRPSAGEDDGLPAEGERREGTSGLALT